MEDLNNVKHQHKLQLNNRKDCIISGVVDVLSFDVNEILAMLQNGETPDDIAQKALDAVNEAQRIQKEEEEKIQKQNLTLKLIS